MLLLKKESRRVPNTSNIQRLWFLFGISRWKIMEPIIIKRVSIFISKIIQKLKARPVFPRPLPRPRLPGTLWGIKTVSEFGLLLLRPLAPLFPKNGRLLMANCWPLEFWRFAEKGSAKLSWLWGRPDVVLDWIEAPLETFLRLASSII